MNREVIELIILDQEEEEEEPINTFNPPRNFDKDNLDNTTYLKKVKPNTEFFLPNINNYQETEYQIDNYEPESITELYDVIRPYKFNENGDLFERTEQWGQEYNPCIQYHLQGHVHFSTVSVYTHILSYTIEQNLEYNLSKTSISPQRINILQCYNTKSPPQRAIIEIEETYDTEFNLGFVPTQRRNTRLFFPPSSKGILKTRIYEHPKNYFKIVRNREFNESPIRQEIEDGKARNKRYKYLLNNWTVGNTTDPPPEILYPIYGRYFNLPVPEIQIPIIVYEYVNHIPKKDYIEYLIKYRELTKRQKSLLDIPDSDKRSIRYRLEFDRNNQNSELILVQKKIRRQTRNFTEYLQLSQYVR